MKVHGSGDSSIDRKEHSGVIAVVTPDHAVCPLISLSIVTLAHGQLDTCEGCRTSGVFLTLILSPLYIENLVLILLEFLVNLFSFPENFIEFFIVIA